MTKVTFFRRLAMLLLFFGAFYSTVVTVTNLTFTEVYHQMAYQEATGNMTRLLPTDKQITWVAKEVVKREDDVVNQNVEADFETIVAELEQYPVERVTATGYTAGVESTGKTADHPEYGMTFSGVEVTRDLYSTIAADLDIFPIGTILYIPDYGYGVVADKGSAIKGHKIDLYYETVEDVFTYWGKKEVDVYVIERGDGHLTEHVLESLNENESLEVYRDQIMNNE